MFGADASLDEIPDLRPGWVPRVDPAAILSSPHEHINTSTREPPYPTRPIGKPENVRPSRMGVKRPVEGSWRTTSSEAFCKR